MGTGPDMTWASAALQSVDRRAGGGPIDAGLGVTLQFHPDRVVAGVPILRAMARDGRYRSQFETGTSNGGLTAHPGGDRWRWESRLFAGAYDEAPAAARPVYGALDHRGRVVGAAPRFGSAHLRLTAQCLQRSTFCYPDSNVQDVTVGTASRYQLTALADQDDQDLLDDYVEAHVHGGVRLSRDVEALVLDPCFRGTDVDADARRLGVPVEWHPGFATTVEQLSRHADYRGDEVVMAAGRVAVAGVLTPRFIGDAAREQREDEQVLKRIWHCTARFGWPSSCAHAARHR